MTRVLVMEPGDTLARLRDVPMDDPSGLQEIVGGFMDAVRLTEDHFLYVNEDPTGLPVNGMASDLLRASPYKSSPSLLTFDRGSEHSTVKIYGTAVAFKSDGVGVEQEPDQSFYNLCAKAGVKIAWLPSKGERYVKRGGINPPAYKYEEWAKYADGTPAVPQSRLDEALRNAQTAIAKANTGVRSITPVPTVNDYLLASRTGRTVSRDEAFDMILQSWLARGREHGFTEESYRIAAEQIRGFVRQVVKDKPRAEQDSIKLYYRNKFDRFVSEHWTFR